MSVRYRVDGVLHDVESPPKRLAAAVISRIKIMANLDIAERRLPQDGRIRLRVQGKEIDLRVSTVPTMHGESVVMRILDKGGVALDFQKLGFADDTLKAFIDVLMQPHGILLVTGPTGSGKTTTLYTALDRLNQPDVKILTVEDPVEYQMVGINQIQVKPQIDLTFANALRSIVRQDPDVIMIGEIRDLETAQIAVQSALTGHLVLSTVHTNDAASTVNRLLDMGVDDYLLTSTVIGILAQRLVRKLCPHCKEPYQALPGDGRAARPAPSSRGGDDVTLYHAKGCAQCSNTGYMGRFCILEMLPMTDPLRSLVMKHATSNELKAEAQREGMVSMYEDGMRKALAGDTTFEEVLRVTREADAPDDARLPLPCRQSGRRSRRRRARRRERERDRRSPARPGPDADADRARDRRRLGGRRRAAPRKGGRRRRWFESKTVTRDQLLAITRELATLLRAGLTLDRALEILIGLAPTPAVAALLQGVRDDVRGGKALSQALDARREIFSRFYVNIVRAGEAGGALGVVLQRLADTMERNKELRESVKSALIYPVDPGRRRGRVGRDAAGVGRAAVRGDVRAGRQGAAAARRSWS